MNQKMHVICVGSYFKKMDLIPFCDGKADLFECFVDWFGEYLSSIFHCADQMVEDYRYVMLLVDEDTHRTRLSRSRAAGHGP